MKKFAALFYLILASILLSCSSSLHQSDNSEESAPLVPISYLTDLEFAKQYENRKVLFIARFERILFDAKFADIEKYRFTHFLVSLTSADSKISLPNVLISTSNPLLPTLRSGELVQIKGILHLRLNEFIYLVVTELRKLKT